jgi:alkyl hydroperoxide reductase subunit AhpC
MALETLRDHQGDDGMLGVGEKFPHFVLLASVSANNRAAVPSISDQDLRGQWLVYFFWPKDFTELSLSEIVDFGALIAEFHERNAQLVGCSVESELAHRGWRNQEEALSDLAFPMLADVRRELCGELGILDEEEGVAQRATFIVDPSGVICFVYVTTSDVSRDPGEVLRVLADLQDRKYRARN